MQESFHDGALPPVNSFASDAGGPVMVTALKGTEDATDAPGGADVVVRAVETRGEGGRSRIELPLLGRTIEQDFGPSQLRTFVVPADPAEPVREVDLIERPLS
jgi:alpha-mannosidase